MTLSHGVNCRAPHCWSEYGTACGECTPPEPPLVHVARRFHEMYEELAPLVGYATRPESVVPWDQVPEANRKLMVMTINRLVGEGTIILPAKGR